LFGGLSDDDSSDENYVDKSEKYQSSSINKPFRRGQKKKPIEAINSLPKSSQVNIIIFHRNICPLISSCSHRNQHKPMSTQPILNSIRRHHSQVRRRFH
jgi:hypothetical protein